MTFKHPNIKQVEPASEALMVFELSLRGQVGLNLLSIDTILSQ